MHDFPHHYRVAASADAEGDVSLTSEGLETILSLPPREFGGPGDRWSPETLLVAAVADCFILSFRAIARASKLSWIALRCEVEGVLRRQDGITKFTGFNVRATLDVPSGTNQERAQRLMTKAEQTCLITNSLSGPAHLEAVVNEVP